MRYRLNEYPGPCENDASKCAPQMSVEGRYDAANDHLTLLLPRKEMGIGRGDIIAGCPPPDGDGACAYWEPAVYTSPTAGMYGYDGLVVTDPYELR